MQFRPANQPISGRLKCEIFRRATVNFYKCCIADEDKKICVAPKKMPGRRDFLLRQLHLCL